MNQSRFAFCASTGRTATMFLASALDALPGVVGLHEGHLNGEPPTPKLPLINLQNRKAWYDPSFARQTVASMRNQETLCEVVSDNELLVDVAFNNAPLMQALAEEHPDAAFIVLHRRCEGFVRSATITHGEDMQPAGWPDNDKELTEREQFVAMGRLKPQPGTRESGDWDDWSAIQKNIWLWHTVNEHLLQTAESLPNCRRIPYESLADDANQFWTAILESLDICTPSNLATCVGKSSKKLNNRKSYQVGPLDTWSEPEQRLYDQLARPLEMELYG